MTTGDDSRTRHAPLDAEEAAMAEAMRRLPAIEPPASLDAQVLAMARNALPQSRVALAAAASPAPAPAAEVAPGSTSVPEARRRRRSAWFGAGFGTLAASVFAAVIGVQMGWFGGSLPGEPASSPAADSEPAPAAMRRQAAPPPADEESHFEVEFLPAPAPAVSAPPPAAETSAPPPAPKERAVARKAAPPSAPPAPAPVVAPKPEQRRRMEAPEPAAAQAAGAPPVLDTSEVPVLPHWQEDAVLPPADWIERIRERVRQGDRFGAERSLQVFQQQHPGQPIPDDLLPLLAG